MTIPSSIKNMSKLKEFIFLISMECKKNPIIGVFFFLPLFPKILPVLVIIAFISSIYTIGFINKISAIKANKSYWFILLFFLIYFIGVFYSTNQKYAWKDIETKLSFLVMPLIFAGNYYSKADCNKFFKVMLYGILISFLYCEIQALYNYSYEMYARKNNIILDYYPNTNFFYTSYFCPFLHHTYFSLYVCLIQAYLFDKLLSVKETFLKKLNLVFIFALLICCNINCFQKRV